MFEAEIKFISDFTLNKIKELGSFITVEKLLSTDIHPSIKKYVEGEIDYLIAEDRKKLIENSLFDYSGAEISSYFNLIGNEIKKTKKISFEDIKNIVLQAVSFNANYVVRPKWSLSKLVFGNNKSVSVNELKLMFHYTYYYEYLNNVFIAYLSKKKILNISVTEFELIVNKIDRELFMLHQSKLVDNALYAIADYFSIGGLNKSSVSIESVENFLKEKNLTELLFKLKRAYSGSSKKKADIEDIRKVLYSTLSIDSPFAEETNTEEISIGDAHFENPLKDDFINSDEEVLENEPETDKGTESVSQTELEIKEEINDLAEKDKETESLSIFEDKVVETPLNIIEDTLSEIEKFELKEKELSETSELNKPEKELNFESDQPTKNDSSIIKEPLDEEDVLAHLTDEIEPDDEIVVLDDKGQEDLLNFYDNELEISIDDDGPKIPDTNVNTDEGLTLDITDLEFEHELPDTNESEQEVTIENLDFEKDLLGADDNKKTEEVKEEVLNESLLKRRKDDVFNYLSKKEIDRIIKNLFNSDSEDFAHTIEKMTNCDTYEEASAILDSVFKYARIKPHNRDAYALTTAISKYFNV